MLMTTFFFLKTPLQSFLIMKFLYSISRTHNHLGREITIKILESKTY
jgi:hypothetical protein